LFIKPVAWALRASVADVGYLITQALRGNVSALVLSWAIDHKLDVAMNLFVIGKNYFIARFVRQ
jgi:hypothetical protein